jgi:hypothetical protein
VTQISKLIARIKNNPKNVDIDDACKVAEMLGFVAGPRKGTSHRPHARPGERMGLNFQDIGGGKIPPYQAKQLIQMIDLYAETDDKT